MIGLAVSRVDVADFLSAVILVYSLIIIIHVLTSMILSFGARMPYARWSDAVLSFLRDVSEPYLRIFRRILPPFGGLDLSPIIGILVLFFVGNLVAEIIRG